MCPVLQLECSAGSLLLGRLKTNNSKRLIHWSAFQRIGPLDSHVMIPTHAHRSRIGSVVSNLETVTWPRDTGHASNVFHTTVFQEHEPQLCSKTVIIFCQVPAAHKMGGEVEYARPSVLSRGTLSLGIVKPHTCYHE